MSEWISCPKCGALMIGLTGGHICPLCGYKLPVQTITYTTGTEKYGEYVEVIRCRNCKHYMNEDENYPDEYGNYSTVCMYMPDDAEENGYCHRAERRKK